jgi:hypothetical protein
MWIRDPLSHLLMLHSVGTPAGKQSLAHAHYARHLFESTWMPRQHLAGMQGAVSTSPTPTITSNTCPSSSFSGSLAYEFLLRALADLETPFLASSLLALFYLSFLGLPSLHVLLVKCLQQVLARSQSH